MAEVSRFLQLHRHHDKRVSPTARSPVASWTGAASAIEACFRTVRRIHVDRSPRLRCTHFRRRVTRLHCQGTEADAQELVQHSNKRACLLQKHIEQIRKVSLVRWYACFLAG